MAKVLWPDKLSEEISSQHLSPTSETTTWNSPEVTSQGRASEANTPSDVAIGFMSVYDSLLRFSLESILAALSMVLNGNILVSTCNYSRNRRLLHVRRPSLYTLLFIHLTLVNFLSAPITWASNNLLFAGRRWSWFPAFLVQMNFCQFTGTIMALSIVSMVINLAATFIILGFSLVQYVAIRFPLKQLTLLRRRNVRSYLIVCWLGVALGWTVPIALIINILSSDPKTQTAVGIIDSNSTTSTIPRISPTLCYRSQFLKIVQLMNHFSYLSTCLITIAYVSAFSLCIATFIKIRAVSKQMAHCKTKPRKTGHHAKIKIQTNFGTTTGVSVVKVTKFKRRSKCRCCSCCSNFQRKSSRRGELKIRNQVNQTSETSDAFKQASNLDIQLLDIQEQQVGSNQGSATNVSCQIPSANERSGPTNDRRAFITIASLGMALTFYLVPSLIIQFLSNGPMGDIITNNAFLIYFMALLPYTKYLVDPVIYGLRMPEMRSSTWCICCKKLMRCFRLPRNSLIRCKEQTTANNGEQSKTNLKSKEYYSNTDAVETKLARVDTLAPRSGQKSVSPDKRSLQLYQSIKTPTAFCQKDHESRNYEVTMSREMSNI